MDGRTLYELIKDRAAVELWPAAVAEQQAPPFGFYLKQDHLKMNVKGGPATGETTTWAVTCVGNNYSEAHTLAGTIREAVDGFSGDVVVDESVTETLAIVRVEDDTDGFDETSGYFFKTLNIKIIILY